MASTRYWDDPVHREKLRAYGRAYGRRYTELAVRNRKDLMALRSLDPRLARLIDRHIDVRNATNGQINRFYRDLERRLYHAKRTGKIDW